MSQIPNVSIIFRQLSGISTQVDKIINKNESKNVNPTNTNQFNREISQLTNGFDRKDRHTELMQRFKSSVRETKELLGIPSQPIYYDEPQDNKKYIIPKIKYRHQEKQRQSRQQNQRIKSSTRNQRKLDEDFYQERNNFKKEFGTQFQQTQENDEIIPNFTKTVKSNFTNFQRNPGNEDLLQRYYDICTRKKKSKIDEQKLRPSKFQRSRQENDEQVQKAMKILLNRRE